MNSYYYKALFDNSLDGVLLTDTVGRILDANPAACAMLGMTPGEIRLAGRDGIVLHNAGYEAALEQRRNTGGYKGELTFIRKDGTLLPVEVSSSTFGTRSFVIFRDISERKRAEAEMERQLAEMHAILDSLTEGVIVFDSKGTLVRANRSARCNMVGMEYVEDVDGNRMVNSDMPAWRAMGGEAVRDVLGKVVYSDGSHRWCMSSASPVRLSDGSVIGAVASYTEVTELKDRTAELEAIIAQRDAVFDTLTEAVSILDNDGNVVRCNPAANGFYAYAGADKEASIIERANAMGAVMECDIPVMELAGFKSLKGVPTRTTLGIKGIDGSRRWYDVGSSPIHTPDGTRIGAVTSAHDITLLRELEEQARKLLRTKDDFVAMASHEMRTPLTVMLASLEMFIHMYDRMDEAQRLKQVKSLYNNALRLNTLVSDLLDYSRLETGHLTLVKSPIDIGSLLDEAVEGFARGCATHAIERDWSVNGCTMLGDPDRLNQVVSNLLANAVRYSEAGTCIRVTAGTIESLVRISVSDQGHGIPEEDLPMLFDRYYRSPKAKATGGMGLGLYISAEIVRLHGGSISVRSRVGEGSTFTVELPA